MRGERESRTRGKMKKIGALVAAILLAWGNGRFAMANDFAALNSTSSGALTITQSGNAVENPISSHSDRLIILAVKSDSYHTYNTAYDYAMKLNTTSVSVGATGAVTGGALYDELHLAKSGNYIDQSDTTGANLSTLDAEMQKRDVTKMTASDGFSIRETSSRDANNILNTTYTVTTDTAAIEDGNTGFTTGDQLYDEIHVADSASADGIKAANTVAGNLKTLDTKVKANTDNSKTNMEAIAKLTNMENLTETGKLAIKNLAQIAVQVKGDEKSITVKTEKDASTGNWTYKVSVAEADIGAENTGLLTAQSAYTEFRSGADGDYIRANQTVSSNLGTLDEKIKANTDGILAIENQIGNKLDVAAGQINPIAAGAAALAALQPEAYDPNDKWSFAVGYGHYKNENATAMGIFFKPEATATFSAGSTIQSGDLMLHAGASFKAGRIGTEGKKQEAKEPMQRLQELEAAVSKQELAIKVPTERMAKWDTENAVESKRLADLEANYKKLQVDATLCMRASQAQEKELAALAKERASFCEDMEKIKAERKKLKEQLSILLGQKDMKKGERQ